MHFGAGASLTKGHVAYSKGKQHGSAAHLGVIDLDEVAAWREQLRGHAESHEAVNACRRSSSVVSREWILMDIWIWMVMQFCARTRCNLHVASTD